MVLQLPLTGVLQILWRGTTITCHPSKTMWTTCCKTMPSVPLTRYGPPLGMQKKIKNTRFCMSKRCKKSSTVFARQKGIGTDIWRTSHDAQVLFSQYC